MPVNSTLAYFSDLSFRTAFVIYVIALLFFIAYYIRQKSAVDAKEELGAQQKALVSVGADSADAAPGESTSDVDADGKDNGKNRRRRGEDAPVTQEDVEKREKRADTFGTWGEMILYVGIAVHIASVFLRGLSAGRFPWGNMYEYISIFCAIALAVAAVVLRNREYRVFWPFILTGVLILMFYGGTALYSESAPVVPALQTFWFTIHVSTVVIGASIFLISGFASLLYLIRMGQPMGKEKGIMGAIAKPLPSAKKLDTVAYRTAIWAFPLFTLGIVLGAIWAEAAWGRYWGWDPKETVSFITWILYAGYLHARATSGWKNQMAAWINIVAFATNLFNLFFINIVVSGLHSYAGLN